MQSRIYFRLRASAYEKEWANYWQKLGILTFEDDRDSETLKISVKDKRDLRWAL
jgi:hypothetical protein